MVTDSVGHVVKTAAEGRKQASLTLDFEDGRLDVVPAGGKPPARKKPKRGDSEPGGQAELF